MEKEETKLYSIRVVKDGKKYTDFVLVWRYEGKLYDVRIAPVFSKTAGYSCLYSRSIKCENYEEFGQLVHRVDL
jgi:hypothetical protein